MSASSASVSPMQRQYDEAKAACGDAILFFRVGDFYELFHEDARTCGRVLGMTVTSRDKGENPTPMAGFPHHQLEAYLAKLIRLGYRVAVCDQVEDPREAKGIVRREVTRIVTAGTLTDDALLDPLHTNLLVAVFSLNPGKPDSDSPVGIAWIELSTGRFEAGVYPRARLLDELARIEPSEVLLREDDAVLSPGNDYGWAVTLRPTWQFNSDEARRQLCQHFGTRSLEGMGWDDQEDAPAIGAAGAVLAYLQETQKTSLVHLRSLLPSRQGKTLEIDAATRRSLEITQTMRDRHRAGSLLSVLDQTCTSMGARLLASWLANPLLNVAEIKQRHAAVQELVDDARLRRSLRESLAGIYDLQRLLGRVATGRASPRDLLQVGSTLQRLPRIKGELEGCNSQRLYDLQEQFELCPELRERLLATLVEECPLHTRDGGFIRSGCNAQLDEFRQLATGGKQWIAQYLADQIQQTGIATLKIGYTKVFGYYLEVTNSHKDKVPDYFERKQTLKNAERYVTPELKEYETKVLSADEQSLVLEQEIFADLRNRTAAYLPQLLQSAGVLAELDVLAGLAELAIQYGYVRPEMTDGGELEIIEGRHPVLDATTPKGTFVPNDVLVGGSHRPIVLITGPNMAGKSTYIRQVALITLMAQLGSFVPAARAKIGVVDRIFARVGASDELSRGQSTFMVEMVETARILNTATNRSLIILDEIGRGTSTFDGLALAGAIATHLHDRNQSFVLFATHYFELTEWVKNHPQAQNMHFSAVESGKHIAFLHELQAGPASQSYGVQVAKLAGIPTAVIRQAKQALENLHMQHTKKEAQIDLFATTDAASATSTESSDLDHELIHYLRDMNPDQLSPRDALEALYELKRILEK